MTQASSDKLATTELGYLDLAKISIQGIWIHIDYKPVFANKSCLNIFGYDTEVEFLALDNILEWVHPNDHERLRQLKTTPFNDADVSGEYEFSGLDKKGSTIHLKNADIIIDWQGIPAILSTFTNITARKNTEKELRLSEEKFSKAFLASPHPIAISKLSDGIMLEVNDAFEEVFEHPREELIGESSLKLSLWTDPQRRTLFVEEIIRNGKVREFESAATTKSGKSLLCYLSSEAITINGEECLVIIVQDITKQKSIEKEIIQSRERLRNLVNKLEEVREEERIGIAREIHDELGQALTGLKIDLNWLTENTPKSEETTSRIDAMLKSIDTTIDVVRKISSDLRPPVLDDLGLLAAIEWATAGFSTRTKIDHRLQIDCDDIETDMARDTAVFRIYQETLTNIARHSGADSFETKVQLIGNTLELCVKDNGIGISNQQKHDNKSIGLIGMFERAKHIGASISIGNLDSGGTQVILSVPLGT